MFWTFLKTAIIGRWSLTDLLKIIVSSPMEQFFNPSQGLIPRRLRRYAFIIDA